MHAFLDTDKTRRFWLNRERDFRDKLSIRKEIHLFRKLTLTFLFRASVFVRDCRSEEQDDVISRDGWQCKAARATTLRYRDSDSTVLLVEISTGRFKGKAASFSFSDRRFLVSFDCDHKSSASEKRGVLSFGFQEAETRAETTHREHRRLCASEQIMLVCDFAVLRDQLPRPQSLRSGSCDYSFIVPRKIY